MQLLPYDIPIEVTQKQYYVLMNRCATLVAGRKSEDGKYYIKAWLEIPYVTQVLNSIQ